MADGMRSTGFLAPLKATKMMKTKSVLPAGRELHMHDATLFLRVQRFSI